MTLSEADRDALLEWLGSVSADPYAFVLGAYPWGQGELADYAAPYDWQREILCDIRDGLLTPNKAILEAVASGHGIGKSALVSWILDWAQSTFTDCKGIVTANTQTQLTTKTWAEFGKWCRLSVTAPLFEKTATARYSRDPAHSDTWRIDMIPWNEQRPEAFAGMHNAGKRIVLMFDEASAIADVIFETAEGALTDKDTEIIWCCFGNPTKNTGRFNAIFRDRQMGLGWNKRQIDSRSVPGTNKAQFDIWAERYGEDSDFFKVRVKGEFPSAASTQLIATSVIEAAMQRKPEGYAWEALVLGVDVARYGSNESVLAPRRGKDAKSLEWQRYRGLSTDVLGEKIAAFNLEHQCDGIFIDEGGVGGGVIDFVRRMGHSCIGVLFGSRQPGMRAPSTNEKVANKRAQMYVELREWLKSGCIPNDEDLKRQLIAIEYFVNKQDEIQLISKEDMAESPDLADALAETLAFPVSPKRRFGVKQTAKMEYDPYSQEAMLEGVAA